MHLSIATLTLSGLLVLGHPPALPAQAHPANAVSDSVALQGSWTMLSGAADGTPLSPGYVSQMKRVFNGADLTVTMGGNLFFKARIELHPAAKPKTIDYHMTEGFTAGAVQLGIYRLSGDTAQFCFGAPGAPRPETFESHPGDKRTLSTWIRSRP